MSDISEKTQDNELDTTFSLKDIFFLCIHKWYWFLISIAIVMSLAYLKVLMTQPEYVQSASILIKEAQQGRSIPRSMSSSSFSDLGMIKTNVNIVNEMLTLHSSSQMEIVVKRLGLDMNYYQVARFHDNVLYGNNLPVEVKMLDVENSAGAGFTLDLMPEGKISLSDFKGRGIEKDQRKVKVDGILADTLSTPLGKVVVFPTQVFAMDMDMKIKVVKTPMYNTVSHYLSELNVSQADDESSVIDLVIKDQSVERAREIISMLVVVYNENWVRDRNLVANNTTVFITDRLHILESELGDVDSDISTYKSDNLIPDLPTAVSLSMTQASQASRDVVGLNNQLYMARYILNYLSNQENRNSLLPVISGVEDLNIGSAVQKYNDLMLDRNRLADNSYDDNPLVQRLDQQLDEIRQSIIASVNNQIAGLNSKIRSMEGVENRATSQIASNPGQAKYLLSVERQQKVKESLYLYLLQKREENELSQAFTSSNTRFIDAPGGSKIPVAPNKTKILALAFIIGFIIPLAIIYIREVSNTVVRGRRDVQSLPMPFIGEIPMAVKVKKLFGFYKWRHSVKLDRGAIVVKPGSRNTINEAFRVVRTNLDFMLVDDERSVVGITSANPGSGKTFVSFNLADAYAIKGKKVLVIDLDLRVSALSVYAGKPDKGVADFLGGQTDDVHSLIVKGASGTKVDVLPVGTIPPNPTELLMSPRLAELIDRMRGEYDMVFLDCPPVEIVADTSIITKHVDKTIFIIRAGLFELSMLPEITEFYKTGRYKNMCLLLNGTEAVSGKYGYHYGYHYGYTYGSSYGSSYGSDD